MRSLNKEEGLQLLKENTWGYVGCNDGYNTYIYPTSYYFDDKNIICHSAPDSKIEMMRENKRVCFHVCSNHITYNQKTVLILGDYSEINDLNERYHSISYFVNKMIQLDSFEDTLIKEKKMFKPVIYRIIIDEIIATHY